MRYKTHNSKFLAIIKVSQTWCHYLKSCKYKAFVFKNHNNLYYFIDIKNLNSKYINWA